MTDFWILLFVKSRNLPPKDSIVFSKVSSQSENTKRIAKNTLMLYVRMGFSMLVSLYTSRVVLNTLGVEDYGIYNVVGGFVGMFSLISSSLSASTSRFLTFELGKGDIDKLKRVFSTSLSIHVVLIVIVFVALETVGSWFLNSRMTIPTDRLAAANWVFQASVLAFLLGLFSVPYNASIVSHERMTVFAYVGIIDVCLRLSIVLFIAHSPWRFDRLIVYALLLVMIGVLLQCFYFIYCGRNFQECRLRFTFDKAYWKEMSSFAGWNFIGCTAGLLKDQGVNVLLNLFIGPVVNAARGIALAVNAAVVGFAGNFMAALSPQITKSYASGNRDYTLMLVERGSRFSFYIISFFALPILFETDFVLTLWLKQYPEHTVNFVRLILLLSLSDVLSNTLITLQNATGHIRNYQIAVGGMLMMNFPLSYVCLKIGFPPESTLLVGLFVSVACMLLRIMFLRKMAGLSAKRYLKNVYMNVAMVFVLSTILPMLPHFALEQGWQRFVLVTIISVSGTSFVAYTLGCNKEERLFFRQSALSAKRKLLG